MPQKKEGKNVKDNSSQLSSAQPSLNTFEEESGLRTLRALALDIEKKKKQPLIIEQAPLNFL